MITKKQAALMTAAAAIIGLAAMTLPAFAATNTPDGQGGPWKGRGMGQTNGQMMRPGVVGSISAINGTTLTLTSRGFGKNTASTTYTVDASNATVVKDNATSTLSSVAVGDMVSVRGTVSGTSVTATAIRDGMMMRGQGPGGMNNFQGNGQPVVAGTVSAVSGSSITITNSGNASYSIDASNAKVLKSGNSTGSISDIAVGDHIVVQGTVNGTSVAASSIMDQSAKQNHPGFFGSIGQFFKHLFGF